MYFQDGFSRSRGLEGFLASFASGAWAAFAVLVSDVL
jgi:hypothetical protein